MNSTKIKQEDESKKDLDAAEAVKKIKELADQANICFFCTESSTGQTKGARPMSVLKVDDDGTLWFVSPKGSDKNKEITSNPSVRLYFHGSAHSDLMYLIGEAFLHKDRSKINDLWNPFLKTWFTEGKDDPRISIIKVQPSEGYYWDSKHGNMVATIKMVVGSVIGKTIDDSVEGTLKV
ncbi:MAG: pyridoxamine 5'-phosphate oxidase family protein [Chitinophagaceae bacterium]|nr:pyridoxamine 5'-phosphate oxidase family protein [Chitinophagaceae bacterium]